MRASWSKTSVRVRASLLWVAGLVAIAPRAMALDIADPCAELTRKIAELEDQRTALKNNEANAEALRTLAGEFERGERVLVFMFPSGMPLPRARFDDYVVQKLVLKELRASEAEPGTQPTVAQWVADAGKATALAAKLLIEEADKAEAALRKVSDDLSAALNERASCRDRAKAGSSSAGGWTFKEVRKTETFTHSRVTLSAGASGGSLTVELDGNYRDLCTGERESAQLGWSFGSSALPVDGQALVATLNASVASQGATCKGGLAGRAKLSMATTGPTGLSDEEHAKREGAFAWTAGHGWVSPGGAYESSNGTITFTDAQPDQRHVGGLAFFMFTLLTPDGTGTYTYVFERTPPR